MNGILWQIMLTTVRNPSTLLAMLLITIIFSALTGLEETEGTTAFVYSESMEQEQLEEIVRQIQLLSDDVVFRVVSNEEKDMIRTRQSAEAMFVLREDDYNIELLRTESLTVMVTTPILDRYYVMNNAGDETITMMNELDSHITFETTLLRGDDFVPYDNTVKNMFGWVLFFVIYTISFSVSDILQLRSRLIWDRIIFSPSSKWSIYSSYVLVAFLIGYIQVMTALTIFYYIFGFPFYDGYWLTYVTIIPYLFAVMAIGIFISSLIRNQSQLSGMIMLFAMGSGMLGGAFWPLHITGDVMYTLSYLSPLRYGMDLLYGSTIYNWSVSELLLPASILVFIGCTFTALGVHYMERRGE